MASLTRDTRDGTWLARWRDPGGVQRKKSFARKVDGQRWLDQMQAQRHRGHYIDPRAATVQVADVVGEWAGGLTHLKASTAARYRNIIKVHVLPKFGGWRLEQVKHSDVQQWVTELTRKGLSPGSVR